ncbi:hypothetical protein Fmac_009305 [Flemingia macrophylla]|uniref:HECT-type E3 ubiquitin transferase n=1 Tax=Flemingia macrophylla TaxID=520843 RepID=A0ABD1MZV1_9FABA
MAGYSDETVESVTRRIEFAMGIPMAEQRLIHKGKQLQPEQTLEQCGIEDDATIHLVARLRSGTHPAPSPVVDYLVAVLSTLRNDGAPVRYGASIVKVLASRHFIFPGFAESFAESEAPMLLASLYVSPRGEGRREYAAECISHILGCLRAKSFECYGTSAALELCKQLRKVCKCDDELCISCRNTLALLLQGCCSWNTKWKISLRDVASFVPELVERMMVGLSLSIRCPTSLTPSFSADIVDFGLFITPLRRRVKMEQGLGGVLSDGTGRFRVGEVHGDERLLQAQVDYLRISFVKLLCKMNECLHVMARRLAGKELDLEKVTCFVAWGEYLRVLKELYEISKVFGNAEEQFWRVLTYHKDIFSVLIAGFAKRGFDHQWILANRNATNFIARRHLAMMHFPRVQHDYDLYEEMLIDRSQLLAESFEYIMGADPEALRSGLFIEFKNEHATGPGVMREWFAMVCCELFNSPLFVACPNDRRRFYPNSASWVYPRHLDYFRFAGRVIALALMKQVQVGIVLDRVFFKQLAGNYNVTLEDVQDADPFLYRSCKQILEMDADFVDSDALGLTFTRELEVFGYKKVVELCPGGKSIVLNSQNRNIYVDLFIKNCFVTLISGQVSHFAMGFSDILSTSNLESFFRWIELQDFDWMLHGNENAISIEDWKAHTKYRGFKETDPQISWFWEIVGKMSEKQRKDLLFFWTSVKYLPVEGFHGLASRLYICRSMQSDSHLPTSHTCFFELCFPPYSSMDIMQDRLGVISQEHIGLGFGTG